MRAGLGHQLDPLVTGGGADVARGGVDGGLSAFDELVAPTPWPLLPDGPLVLVAPVPAPAWWPGRALPT
jgi:hypothetical protein